MDTPWAILLCKFNDDDSEPFGRSFYERLFTPAGSGSLNMVDYFRDCSHGSVDISGSQVLGWYTLDRARSEYTGSGVNQQGRQDLITWARQAATDAGVNLAAFYGVVVCMNVPTDLFGGGGRQAVCDLHSMQPSLLAQEMGHGYGLAHSRADGSTADYEDRWDTMSTANAYSAPHPEFQWIGPGLNASNMRSQAWLHEPRVWRASSWGFRSMIELRPLHRPDLPGLLAAELPHGYLVEFRVSERWDGGIPRAAVLVHRFKDGNSYLMRSTAGNSDLVEGDKFEHGVPDHPWRDYARLEVLDIDAKAQSARISLHYVPPHPPELEFDLPGQIVGGLKEDGGGIVVVNGRVIQVPPWDPTFRILEEIAVYRESGHVRDSVLRDAVRHQALEAMSFHLGGMKELHVLESPPREFDTSPRDREPLGEYELPPEHDHQYGSEGKTR